MHLCFAPLRLIAYHFYDDPIRNPSITAGTEFFDVQKATSRYGKAATCGQRCSCSGCSDGRSGGGGNSQDQEASGRSNRSGPHFLLPSAGRQDPLSRARRLRLLRLKRR